MRKDIGTSIRSARPVGRHTQEEEGVDSVKEEVEVEVEARVKDMGAEQHRVGTVATVDAAEEAVAVVAV